MEDGRGGNCCAVVYMYIGGRGFSSVLEAIDLAASCW